MGDVKGFLKHERKTCQYRPVCERKADFAEVFKLRDEADSRLQASRCMDCGTPFCHSACPLANIIPEWNDYVFNWQWDKAFELLDQTNCLPEVTGRVCPALCEYGCVLGINDDPVTIRDNELAIVEYAFKHGLVKPRPPKKRTGKKVAVVGSGPAGLSCAVELNRAGHHVVVFERDEKIGGLMRFGIPAFKLDKSILDRRIALWEKEGVEFVAKKEIKTPVDLKGYDAVCLTGGSRVPRDLNIPGRKLKGIYFALDYLTSEIDSKDKSVVVIGGGDTGADCVGTANRRGAKCVVQIEILSRPPEERTPQMPWPTYPMLLKNSTSHEEGCSRQWQVLTKKFKGQGLPAGRQGARGKGIECVKVHFPEGKMAEIPGTEFEIEADLVLIAAGFLHPEHDGLLASLGLEFDSRGNVKTGDDYQTSKKGVFTAGDMRRGQSLIVWALAEGRGAAASINRYLS